MKTIRITETTKNKYFEIAGNQIGTLEGWEYPSVISAIDDIPGNKGALYVNSKFGRRRLSIEGYIPGQTLAQRIAMGLALRQTGTIKKMTFTTLNDLALQAYVEVLSLDYKYSNKCTSFLIELVAPDPRFYSQTLHDTELDNSDSKAITNAGNEITSPSIKLLGAGSNWVVTNTTTGKSFTLAKTISGTDYVTINCADRTVLLNDTTSVFPDFDGDFFVLDPGANTITTTVTGGNTSTEVHVLFRDSYITL